MRQTDARRAAIVPMRRLFVEAVEADAELGRAELARFFATKAPSVDLLKRDDWAAVALNWRTTPEVGPLAYLKRLVGAKVVRKLAHVAVQAEMQRVACVVLHSIRDLRRRAGRPVVNVNYEARLLVHAVIEHPPLAEVVREHLDLWKQVVHAAGPYAPLIIINGESHRPVGTRLMSKPVAVHPAPPVIPAQCTQTLLSVRAFHTPESGISRSLVEALNTPVVAEGLKAHSRETIVSTLTRFCESTGVTCTTVGAAVHFIQQWPQEHGLVASPHASPLKRLVFAGPDACEQLGRDGGILQLVVGYDDGNQEHRFRGKTLLFLTPPVPLRFR